MFLTTTPTYPWTSTHPCTGHRNGPLAPPNLPTELETLTNLIATGDLPTAGALLGLIRADLNDQPTATDVPCGYHGPLDDATHTNGTTTWACPACGTEYTETHGE